jgi:hypothetical protein
LQARRFKLSTEQELAEAVELAFDSGAERQWKAICSIV